MGTLTKVRPTIPSLQHLMNDRTLGGTNVLGHRGKRIQGCTRSGSIPFKIVGNCRLPRPGSPVSRTVGGHDARAAIDLKHLPEVLSGCLSSCTRTVRVSLYEFVEAGHAEAIDAGPVRGSDCRSCAGTGWNVGSFDEEHPTAMCK